MISMLPVKVRWIQNVLGDQQVSAKDVLLDWLALLCLAWPIAVNQGLRNVNWCICTALFGWRSQDELNAVTLASTVLNIFGLSVDLGMSSAVQSFFSQAHGTRNKKLVGLLLQRVSLIMFSVYLVMLTVLINIEPLLLLLQQDPFISSLAALYVRFYMPALLFDILGLLLIRYLQAQTCVKPVFFASAAGSIFMWLSHSYLIPGMNWGLRASAVFSGLANFIILLVVLGYICWWHDNSTTWPGLMPVSALQNWGIFFKLGIPGVFTVAMEEWCFEVITFLAGAMGKSSLAGQSVAWQIQMMAYVLPSGIANSVNICVSNSLGAKRFKKARRLYLSSLTLLTAMGLVEGLLIVLLQDPIICLFTNDAEVIEQARSLIYLLAVIPLLESLQSAGESVLASLSLQSWGLGLIILGYFIVGGPVGCFCAWYLGMGIKGYWLGMMIGILVIAVIAIVSTYFLIDWSDPRYQMFEEDYAKDFYMMVSLERQPLLLEDVEKRSVMASHDNFRTLLFHRALYLGSILTLLVASIAYFFYWTGEHGNFALKMCQIKLSSTIDRNHTGDVDNSYEEQLDRHQAVCQGLFSLKELEF